MRTGNPALNAKTFAADSVPQEQAMTIQGTVNKTGILLLILIVAAVAIWQRPLTQGTLQIAWVSASGAFAVALVTVFKKSWAGATSPVYAALEGVVLGAVSAVYEYKFPGIVMNAVILTVGTLFALLLAYQSRLIKATENFKLGVVAATGGIAILYVVDIVLHIFGKSIPFIHESGIVGIGFSVFVVVLASLNLVLDFDFIESGAAKGAPKYMEWYGAFGLMVTLVWLYLEILRLLSKTRRRR
jgi:uncharacterized YccA/Bax inhibitor family protein